MIATPQACHVLSAGTPSGPCVVFVHGLEDGWRAWGPLARSLGPGWRALALDMPWRAGNDYAWRWLGSPGDWVAAGLAAVAAPSFVLVGHSFGANAVLGRLAAGEPRSRAAVLAAPFYRPAEDQVTWKTVEQSRRTFERQICDGMRARLRGAADGEVFDLMLKRTFERIGPEGFFAAFEQYLGSGHLPLGHVGVPTVILAGEQDPGMFPEHMYALGARLPGGIVSCRPEFDHFCHLGHPDEVANAIEDAAAMQHVVTEQGA